MIAKNETACPGCGGELKYYDSPKRLVRTKGGSSEWIKLRRFHCPGCDSYHRELPDFLFPFKHYETKIIRGVLEGRITSDDLGYENFPCEMTMSRWKQNDDLTT